MQFENKKLHMGKEVRIYTSFSISSDGSCRVRTLVPLFPFSMVCAMCIELKEITGGGM